MRRPALCLLVSVLALMRAAAQSPAAPSLAQVIERAAGDLGAGGIVAAEVRGDEIRYHVAGRPTPRPDVPPERVIFEIGSITKVFTSLVLASTVREGKATLEDPISRHLPPDLVLDPATAAITLGQLASHTSGLPRLPDNLRPSHGLDPYADYSVERLYDFLRRHRPAQPPPRPVAYSNLGAGLLGHLLARIHGRDYETLVTERITGPLGLRDTVITLDAEQASRFAAPYSGSVKVLPWQLNALGAAGALRSTAADLAKFAQALHDPDSPIQADWQFIAAPRAPSGGGGDQVGLGIFIGTIDGRTFYNHAGGTGGFRTLLEVIPQDRRATIVLINNDALEAAPLAGAVRGLGRPAAADDRPAIALAPEKLADYPGVYVLAEDRRFTVVRAGDRLMIRLTGQPFLPVEPIGPDRFLNRQFAAEFRFARDAGGQVESVTLHQRGAQLAAPRRAEPPPPVRFLTADQLAAFLGQYELAPNVLFEVTTRAGHLFVKLTGQQSLPVFCDRDDHFIYDVVDAALTFERDTSGQVTALILHQNGLDQRAARLP